MFRADGERRSFSLPRTVTVIGRREDCDLRIPLGDVSRKHCRFIADNDTLKIEDLGSSNGTFHNGVRIQEAIVNAGDNVQVGPVMFVVQINGVPSDEEIQPPIAAPAASDDTHAPPADIEVDQLEEVSEEMPDAPGYSAVRAMLRVLEEKGHIRHEEEALRYVFLPTASRAQAARSALAHLVDTFFEGSTERAVAALIDGKLSREELDRLAALIQSAKKEGR